jgi:GAF domain-containing protein
MSEEIKLPAGASRRLTYEALLPQIDELLRGERNVVANAANICAALRQAFGFFWVGFYFVADEELVLGPFQGPVACTRIAKGKGVCGQAWQRASTIVVPDVDLFPGHIACSSLSRSEIVVPLLNHENKIMGVLDVDSEHLNYFSDIDKSYLEEICKIFVSSIEAR